MKGTHVAIDVAERCGLELIIAGNVSKEPGGFAYFRERVQPRLKGGIRWVGEVNDTEKGALCRGALALLFPVDCAEAFGLVMIEALSCGTPVIAFRRASVPEVIEHGKTGYVVEDAGEMEAAVGRIDQISRTACARIARERFSYRAMVTGYLQVYQELCGVGPAAMGCKVSCHE
jgi:glycosyltransferase involved in cell wall biosynthesis